MERLNTLNNKEHLTMYNTNDRLIFSGQVREKLCKNKFYSEDKLGRLMQIFESSQMSSYISSYSIDNTNNLIRLNMRQKFLDKFDERQYNSMDFYDTINFGMNIFYKEFRSMICSILGNNDSLQFYAANKSMFYFIQRIENCIIIKF